jgi:hypothetical protein
MRKNLDWEPYFEVASRDLSPTEKLTEYARIARGRLAAAEFEDFCAKHLAHFDEVADAFFGSVEAKAAVRRKVEALFPANEWDQFTELFFARIQDWRKHEGRA